MAKAKTNQTPDRVISGVHPCPRSVDVCAYFVSNWSEPGAIVLDFCLGSGTTIVAAESTGRIAYGIELAEAYCAVILERLSGLGLHPRLSG